ncbi:MAG: hypothetical protein KDC91_11415, partial [Flavobacteriaceae bacterium]|nr:hypothetical protein [Flavobacteriaceae bacterium]
MNTNHDEIDLGSLFEGLKKAKNSFLTTCFNAINFALRNWLVIVILIVVGVGLGYFSQMFDKAAKEAKVVIRTNFNTGEYTYNALEILQEKSKQKDSVFLEKNGFNKDTVEIKKIEVLPIVSFNDITEKYDPNDRNLDALLRYIEFEENEEKVNSFNSSYKYHTILLTLDNIANDQTINKIINYLNNQELIKRVGTVGKETIIERLEGNKNTLTQIDSVLTTYNKTQPLPSPDKQIYVVDKNFNISTVLETKIELMKQNQELNEDLVYADKAIVKISNEGVYEMDSGLLGKKTIIYPFIFVFLFFLISWVRHMYQYMKKIAMEQ